ncbi:MAG: serine/threonine-protein kinase [Polyangia bacterium]|jgi:serine/threonine protein kinase
MSQSATLPTQLGRYTELKLLGQGGMGAVYKAYDPSLQRTVAIKVMLGQNPEFLARFEREARAVAKLSHPNVVQVYDFGRDEQGNPYFVMELLSGRSLDSLLKEKGPLPNAKVADVLRQAADGLQAAHAVGIVHRDVKPHNLMLDDGGNVKIVDFGIARDMASTDELTSTQATPGTLHYMAPEVLSGQSADARADIYALGLVGFHLLVGKPPFTGQSAVAVAMKQINEPLPDLRDEAPGVPASLRRLIERMTEKRPEARVQTCGEVAREAALIAHEIVSGTTVQSGYRGRSSVSRPLLVAAAALGAVAVVVMGLAMSKSGRRGPRPMAEASRQYVEPPEPPTSPPPSGPPVNQATPTPGPTPPVAPGQTTTPDEPSQVGAQSPSNPLPESIVRHHQGPLRVAVLRFKNLAADRELAVLVEGIGEVLMDTFANSPALRKRVKLLERNQFDEQNLVELLRSKEEYIDKSAAAKLGKILGAEVVLQGSFEKQGKLLRVVTRMTSLQDGEVLDSSSEVVPYVTTSDKLRAAEIVAEKIQVRLLALAGG